MFVFGVRVPPLELVKLQLPEMPPLTFTFDAHTLLPLAFPQSIASDELEQTQIRWAKVLPSVDAWVLKVTLLPTVRPVAVCAGTRSLEPAQHDNRRRCGP